MKLADLKEMYDDRKEFRRQAGDLNYHQSIENAQVYLWQGNKRIYGPFPDKVAAERFKKNRPDRIPADAVAR